jgi:thioester reductase-like protein
VPEPLALVTGFPGFIGRRLVAALLAEPEARVTALVEPRMVEAARAAAAELDGAERVEILPGDIAERGLGLADLDRERLEAEMTAAFHLAAIYDLSVPLELAQRVNVDGTGNVLELCSRAEHLERLNYVSTAYVAGLRHGVVYEHELALGQGFKNHYESTKFQAELWVREAMDRVPTAILRPAIVVGDARTGETQKFDGPYYILRVIAVLERLGRPLPNFGRADAPFNVVPVDFVVDAMVAASHDLTATGRTLHLVDPDPMTARELTAMLSRHYAGRETRGRVPSGAVEMAMRSAFVRRVFAGTPRESIRYLNHSVRFDTRQADELLGRHGLRCPRFADYAGAIVRFFREHEDDPAFAPRT